MQLLYEYRHSHSFWLSRPTPAAPPSGWPPANAPAHQSQRGAIKPQTDSRRHRARCARPHWCSAADSDPEEAQRTRERMLAELAARPVLVIGTHFAGATAGRIVKDGDAYRMDV